MLPFANQSFNGSAGLTQGGWVLQAGEVRAGIAYGGAMIYGSSQWGAPKGQGPHGFGNGGQIYAQYQPPSGPIALECQMPVYESAAASMTVAHFPSSSAWKCCAGSMNSKGVARVWTRDDATNSWQPTTAWASPAGTTTEIRSMLSYTDSVTGTDLLFAGLDDLSGGGGIFSAIYDANTPGNLIWGTSAELELSTTNQGPQPNPSVFEVRVMSFAVGPDEHGKQALFATVGTEIYKRIDGESPTWQLVWTKPLVQGESSQSGLRALTQYGSGNFLVFVEGTDWSVVQLTPGAGYAATKLYGITDLSAALGPGFIAGYAIGAYNQMCWVNVAGAWCGLIGLSINCPKYPAGTPIFWGGASANAPWLAQAYYLVLHAGKFTLKQIAAQANPTIAPRFMTPFSSFVMAGGPDFEMRQGEPIYLGWGAWDTAANAVAGA